MNEIKYPAFSNDFYKNVLESLEDYGVFTTNKDGIVTSWNKGAENVLGYTEDEICGKTAKIIFTEEDCNNEVPEHEFTEAFEKGRGMDERYHQRKDGSLFWASGLVFPLFDGENNHIGFTKILRNLSNRKQAEEDLLEARKYAQSIVETSKEPILILNPDLTVNSAGNAFYKLFHVNKEDAEHTNLFEVLKKVLDPQPLQEQMQNYDSFENLELSIPATEKIEERVLLVSSRKVFQTFKSIGQYLLTFEDVTSKRKRERAREDFISIASHELKTPISIIKSYSQLLGIELNGKNSDKASGMLNRIITQSEKLNKLTSLLLDASAFKTGTINLNKEPFVLLELLLEIIKELNLSSKHKISLQKITDVSVLADKMRIAQVITNLLNNAIKYSPDAHEVVVKIESDEENSFVKISVQDFGIGIPSENQSELFKRFSRTNNAMTRNIDGFGMGLYISAEIVKAHGGKIGVDSDGQSGSVFYFELPILGANFYYKRNITNIITRKS